MPPHTLIDFEIQRYYHKEPRFHGVYSRDHLPEIKNVAYVINFDDYKWIGTHWIALHLNDDVVYIARFGTE